MELQVRTYVDGGHMVFAASGEIDVHTAPTLRTKIGDELGAGQRHLVVDLTEVDFLDSTGLGVLVAGLGGARAAGGDMSLVCSRGSLLKLLTVTGLDQVFVVHPTAAAATAVPPAA